MALKFKTRKTIDFSSFPIIIEAMSENDSKAAKIIDELIDIKGENNVLAILILLDDMNIRGFQLYQLYKMCDQNIEQLYNKILNITKEDIIKLNKATSSLCMYKAVFEGTHLQRLKRPDEYIFTNDEREEILNYSQNLKLIDIYPTIKINEAIETINKNGFVCGYKKNYLNKNHDQEVYRVFYNNLGDIMYVHSLEEKDIFLWGDSKLNVICQNEGIHNDVPCDTYKNLPNIISYNIDLKEHPFNTYMQIKNNIYLNDDGYNFYNKFLIPVIETVEGIKYKEEYPQYNSSIVSSLYDLLKFETTYWNLDCGLKKIYKPLLGDAGNIAYDKIIEYLSKKDGLIIATELQNLLGYKLDKEKLLLAKNRFVQKHECKNFNSQSKFLSKIFTEDPLIKEINAKIATVLTNDITPIFSSIKKI